MTQEDKDNLLLNIYKEQKQIRKEITKVQEEIIEIQKEIIKIQNDISKLKKQTEVLWKETRNISGRVTVIEQLHGEKIQILLDVATGHIEKFDKQDKRIAVCENKIEKNSSKIYYLEDKVQGL